MEDLVLQINDVLNKTSTVSLSAHHRAEAFQCLLCLWWPPTPQAWHCFLLPSYTMCIQHT